VLRHSQGVLRACVATLAQPRHSPVPACRGMDPSSIAEITNLSVSHVSTVLKRCNNDEGEIERAINLYLESQSGPFKEMESSSTGGWAESGKARRSKKVRCAAYLARAQGASLARAAEPAAQRAQHDVA
jgi:hypothetical protein